MEKEKNIWKVYSEIAQTFFALNGNVEALIKAANGKPSKFGTQADFERYPKECLEKLAVSISELREIAQK